MLNQKQIYDVWQSGTAVKTAYRATIFEREDAETPSWAVAHIDTVEAYSKREAVSKV